MLIDMLAMMWTVIGNAVGGGTDVHVHARADVCVVGYPHGGVYVVVDADAGVGVVAYVKNDKQIWALMVMCVVMLPRL